MNWKTLGKWIWNNLGNITILGGWMVSAGILPFLISFNSGVTPIGYGIASIGGLLSFALLRALWARARLWSLEAKHRELLASSSSPFDPMASVFQGKRIFLRDLVPAGRRFVQDKKFINCEIIGPGNVVVALNKSNGLASIFQSNIFHDVDCIQIVAEPQSLNAIYFPGCDFDGCQFFNINLLFYRRTNDNWNWITPASDSPPLIGDASKGE